MQYFIDTEFIEKVKKDWRGRAYHFQQLISIGIVCEDGREYYAINKDFNKKEASQWVQDNVINKLSTRYPSMEDSPREREESSSWKSLDKIRNEVFNFFNGDIDAFGNASVPENIEIYAYYADYDWIMFCSIFGTMMDLPIGMPMYCKDIKQIMDDKGLSKEWKRINCPDPVGEHNALVDARWNQTLYKLIFN